MGQTARSLGDDDLVDALLIISIRRQFSSPDITLSIAYVCRMIDPEGPQVDSTLTLHPGVRCC